jgi:membrane protein required for colicin V production
MSSIFSAIKDFGIIDSVALALIIFFLIRGFKQGAAGVTGSMVAWLLTGLFFYFGFSFVMGEILSFSFLKRNPDAAHLMAFVITLFISIALFFFLRKVLTDSIGLTIPSPFNEILGAFFGLLKSLLLIAFICICGLFDPKKGEPNPYFRDSITVKLLNPVISKITQR